MRKMDSSNVKIIIIGGAVAFVLLGVLIFLIVKLNSIHEPLVNIRVSTISVPSFTLPSSSEESTPVASEDLSSEEASSQEAVSQAPSSSAPPAQPASSAPAVSASKPVSSEPPSSSEPEETEESQPEEEPVSSEAAPARSDGLIKIELEDMNLGRRMALDEADFDAFMEHLNAVSFEETDATIDESMVVSSRVYLHTEEGTTVYTVYPFWTIGGRVCLDRGGGKEFLEYLKSFEVFKDEDFAY